MAAFEGAVDDHRGARQRQGGLGDVVARVGGNGLGERLAFRGRGVRADQHAVAAGFVDRLDDQLVEVLQDVAALPVLPADVRRHVGQHHVFAQIVGDHLRHVGVYGLVVRHPGAGSVGQRHAPGLVHLHEAGHAEAGVGPEGLRIQKIVVDAPVDDVHRLEALGGAHHDDIVHHRQVAALDELHAHLLRQEGVLEIGRVVHAGGEHHHRGIVHPRRRQGLQHVQQAAGIVVHRAHLRHLEHLREGALEHLAVFQHVRHAGGAAQVVFEHVELAVAVAHQVDAADVAPDALRRVESDARLQEVARRQDELSRHDAVLDDALGVIDVVDEQVERLDALLQALLDGGPVRGADDAGQDVEREDALGPRLVAVHGERNAEVQQVALGRLLPPHQLALRQRNDALQQRRGAATGLSIGEHQFVVEGSGLVGREVHRAVSRD